MALALALAGCEGGASVDADTDRDASRPDDAAVVCERGVPSAGGCRCVDGSYWELSFDSDPTRVDLDGDGTPDWRMRDGEPFASSELGGGVWRAEGRILDTNPDALFDASTSVHLRYRATTLGDPGAVFWINTAPRPGRVAAIHADLSLQDDGTQTLVILGRDPTGDVELARFAELDGGFVDLWLELEPEANALVVWLEGERQGRYPYPVTSGDPADAFASLLGWGSRAEFDFVRVESCPDGAATPDRTVPPACAESGGVVCGGVCVDPALDDAYCGASGDCVGANAGTDCASDMRCVSGVCSSDVEPRPAPDVLVSLDGVDTGDCGAPTSPCRTVEYAVEVRAVAGQLVGVMPGVYDETGAIDVPRRVSLTGTGADATEVVLRPDYVAEETEYFINLVDAELDQIGDQRISYVTLEAHASSHVGWRAIHVQNRDGVRIHHCRITNWDRTDRIRNSSVVDVVSTQELLFPRHEWWRFLPMDLGSAGDYSSWTSWPSNPIDDFEFDHNLVLHSGDRQRNTDGSLPGTYRPHGALELRGLRNSSIHDNDFDLRGVFAKAISGVSAFWDNVDTYNNVFRITSAAAEGWMGPSPAWQGTFAIETWMHINGCEWYDNVSNDGWSILMHKDSDIRGNILLRDQADSIGIEVALIDHSAVHGNYIVGGRGTGIASRHDKPHNVQDGWVYENILIGVRGWGIRSFYDRTFCAAGASGAAGMYTYNNLIDGSRWGGIDVVGSCDTVSAPLEVSIRNNISINSGDGWAGVVFQLSPNFDTLAADVNNNLTFGNAGGDRVQCRALGSGECSPTSRAGIDETGTVAVSPRFAGAPDIVTGSPDLVTVNDDDGASTRRQGTWTPASGDDIRAYPVDGDARVHAAGAGDWFEFQAAGLSTERATEVALWWPRNAAADRSSAVPVTVYDGDDSTPLASFTVDQAGWDSSEWYYLDSLVFRSGRARLRVHSVEEGSVVADAVLWAKLGYGYQLAEGSAAVDAGSSAVSPVVTSDFFGTAIPRGAGPDIGIHER